MGLINTGGAVLRAGTATYALMTAGQAFAQETQTNDPN